MREPDTAQADRLAPNAGDVIVERLGLDGPYRVRQEPGISQFAAPRRDEAIRLARTFAQRASVDLWYWENDGFKLLERYRPDNASSTGEAVPAEDHRDGL